MTREERRGTRDEGRKTSTDACRIIVGLALALLLPATPLRAELVDRVVASINTEVVTRRDLRQAIALNEAVSGASPNRSRLAAETLDGLINRRLLLLEARRLQIVEVSEQDVDNELAAFKKRLGAEKAFGDFLRTADLTEAELRRTLAERLLVQRFLEKKIGLFVRINRAEAERYFSEHPEAFAGKRFSEVSRPITAMLTERKTDQQITQYLADLRNKADIRINTRGE